MASSSKTENLGLNKWVESDRPKRSDFVMDNTIIDSTVGGHINNSTLHLSQADREKINTISAIYQYAGTGESSVSLTLPFAPSFVIVLKKGEPPVSYNGGDYAVVNFSYAAAQGINGGGITLKDSTLTVTQSSSASNGSFYNLNRQYSQYAVFLVH